MCKTESEPELTALCHCLIEHQSHLDPEQTKYYSTQLQMFGYKEKNDTNIFKRFHDSVLSTKQPTVNGSLVSLLPSPNNAKCVVLKVKSVIGQSIKGVQVLNSFLGML